MTDHTDPSIAKQESPPPTTVSMATSYGRAGYRIFPVRPGTKLPAIAEWQNKATADPAQIAAWFGGDQDYNIGLATGQQPNGLNLFTIDVDRKNEGIEHWSELLDEHGWAEWQQTSYHWTPSAGMHLFTDAPDELRNSRGRMAPGIDTRGEGGYVVVPPSKIDGHCYAAAEGSGLLDREPIVLPAWCQELLARRAVVAPVVPIRGDYAGTSAFDWIRHHESWPDVLARNNWTMVRAQGGDTLWKRPGKTDRGHSAVLHASGAFVIFTTDIPLELERLGKPAGDSGVAVSIGDFVCAYEHGGDRTAMARTITREQGLGPVAGASVPGSTSNGEVQAGERTDPAAGYLSDEFWESRDFLRVVRQAARARRVGPDATLLNVLIRYAALVPPNYWLPPEVGSRGSLDLLGCVVGVTGIGKSRALSCSRDLIPPLDQAVRWDLPLGSGEGIPQAYMVWKLDDNGKPTKEQVVGVRGCHFIVDEGVAMAKQGGRAGSTLIPTINSAITGEGLGQVNAKVETNRVIPAGTVRFSCVMNIQEENAHLVFTQEMVSIGFTGRLIFVKAGDPAVPDQKPAFPEDFSLRRLPIISGGVELSYDPAISAEIDAARVDSLRSNKREGAGDSHSMLLRCKIASLFALVEGRREVSLEDWKLGGDVIRNSSSVVAGLEALRISIESRASRAIGHKRADIEEIVAERASLVFLARCREWVIKQVLKSENGLTPGELRRRADSSYRPHIEDAIDAAVGEGRLRFDGVRAQKP